MLQLELKNIFKFAGNKIKAVALSGTRSRFFSGDNTLRRVCIPIANFRM